MVKLLTIEEIDAQSHRAYGADRVPGAGGDRNSLGETGRSRVDEEERGRRRSEGLCVECGTPIAGRPKTASTCLVHRGFPGPLSREELVALIADYESAVEQLRAALGGMDETEEAGV